MKKLFLYFGILFLLSSAACQTQTATPIAFVSTSLPTNAIPSTTLTSTHTPTKFVTSTNTLRPRRQTQTAFKSITPDTATPTPTRPPTNTPLPTPLAREWDSSVKNILPAPLYLLAQYQHKTQIWRFERDAKTKTLITKFGEAIWDFDVSPTTGELAIATQHGLFISDAWGGNIRRVKLEGEDEPVQFDRGTIGLSWSPDGTKLVFAHKGAVIYLPSDGTHTNLYSPRAGWSIEAPWEPVWAPNGQQILVRIGDFTEGDCCSALIVMDTNGKQIATVDIEGEEFTWSLDSQSLYVAQSFSSPVSASLGLRRQNLFTKQIVELLPTRWNADSFFVAGAQESPDGQLYFLEHTEFLPNGVDIVNLYPLKMHRASKNDLSNPTLLRTDGYPVNQVLWSPDFDLAVIVKAELHTSAYFGYIYILTTDNSPAIQLPIYGAKPRWGQN